MEDNPTPKNRKERRAAARESGKPMTPATSTPKLKLAQPDRSKPTSKTLLDIYDEKKKDLLDRGQPFSPHHSDGQPRDESGNILTAGLHSPDSDDEPIGPLGDAFFWAACFTILHFTLDVLVYQQYAQTISWSAIFQRSATILPILWVLVYLVRCETARKVPWLRQGVVFVAGTAVGCYTIRLGNEYAVFAVLKQAPALGTVWVWAVIEMDLWVAVASLLVDVGFLVGNGYSAF